jgi:hypothetical protein
MLVAGCWFDFDHRVILGPPTPLLLFFRPLFDPDSSRFIPIQQFLPVPTQPRRISWEQFEKA